MPVRMFATPTPDCLDHLKRLGITNSNVVFNPTYPPLLNPFRVSELYEYALQPEHIGSVDPNIYNTSITETGALCAYSGLRTGRSPKDKRVVDDKNSKDVEVILTFIGLVGSCQHADHQ